MDYRIDEVIHIRVLVLTLGESQHANWRLRRCWNSGLFMKVFICG